MAAKEAGLIDSLMAIALDQGNRTLERRLADMAVWYYSNKQRIPPENAVAKCEFLDKAVWIMIEIIALQQDRIHDLENKNRSKHLYVPSGVTVNGRRFG